MKIIKTINFNNVAEEITLLQIFGTFGILSKEFKNGKYIIYRSYDKTGRGRYSRSAASGDFSIEKIEKITDLMVNGYFKKNCWCITKAVADKISNKSDILNEIFKF